MNDILSISAILISCLFGTIFMIHFWLTARMLKDLDEGLGLHRRLTDSVLEYCLRHIIRSALETEDYEVAARATDVLKKYEALRAEEKTLKGLF